MHCIRALSALSEANSQNLFIINSDSIYQPISRDVLMVDINLCFRFSVFFDSCPTNVLPPADSFEHFRPTRIRSIMVGRPREHLIHYT